MKTMTEVVFEIFSPEPDLKSIDRLDSDVKAAAAAGDIVASIIQKAASRSVLTPAMAMMDTRVINLQTSLRTVTAKVVKQTQVAAYEESGDGERGKGGTSKGGSGLGVDVIAGIAVGAFIAAVLAATVGVKSFRSGPPQPPPPASSSSPQHRWCSDLRQPVVHASAESALVSALDAGTSPTNKSKLPLQKNGDRDSK
jgi:hypothetical protein